MNDQGFTRQMKHPGSQETFFRLIKPEDYAEAGIDPQDVPIGTFAAEDHPSFLPSRFGGNAYGLGLIEQSILNRADTDFLESLDFQDKDMLRKNARRLNAIYQKLGLLIRFSRAGKRYFLIPINLVAHSLQEIKTKADEIEELIIQHIFETRTDRLDIGLLTAGQDLIVHELRARLSTHRIFIFESIEKLRSWRLPLDIVILPKDPFEYLLEQQLPNASKRPMTRKRLSYYAMYLAGKIYDLLEANGKIHVLAHSPGPQEDQSCHVRFKSDEDLKFFLLFTHTFKTKQKYEGHSSQDSMEIHISDFHYYLNRFAFFDPHLKGLLNHHKPEEMSIEDVNRLPYLNLRLPHTHMKNPEKQWRKIFELYFFSKALKRKSPRHHHQYWEERLEMDRELPESLFVFLGTPRRPQTTLEMLEEDIKASGMEGCSLPLVAEYRNTFRYVMDVLNILAQIRNNTFQGLTELARHRLSNPFRSQNEQIAAVAKLLGQMRPLEKSLNLLNPDGIEGPPTPILENIPKLSLHGFSPAQLREIVLIVVGHSTMSRIVFGKLPAKTLKPITDHAGEGNRQDIVDLLRLCRLMSLAEIAGALGDAFTEAQAIELFRIYDDAVAVGTDSQMTWDRQHDLRISSLGGVQNKAIREMMKFFNLFEFLDNWKEFQRKNTFEKEVVCDYQSEKLMLLEEALRLARIAEEFKQQFMSNYIFGQSYFFRQFLDTEFHGTGHLFPKLGTQAGFILLWIAVNASERHIINFNPVLAGIARGRREPRISKMRETLLRIPFQELHPNYFDSIKKTLSGGSPAFIFDSGLRLMNNPSTRAIDISFVDVDENIQQIESLLPHFESQKLRGVSLKDLQEMERRFSELVSFHEYLQREGCTLQCELFESGAGLDEKDREISRIERQLKSTLQSQVFIPEEIYDTLSILAKHCPDILRFFLPEFHAFGNLLENWPTRQKQSLGSYVMRCLEKFQALVIRDRNSFQDPNTFYQLAKQEFGPLAEEGIGATHAQMDILEHLVERIQQQPSLYQALTLALLFQEIAKIEMYSIAAEDADEAASCWMHAEQGSYVLSRSDLLKKYGLAPQVERMVSHLVRHHGLIGHVIQGEEPVLALHHYTEDNDEILLDVFVLHGVLAASAVQEGLMVSDLVDEFLYYRSVALEILRSRDQWAGWLRTLCREKGAEVLPEFQLTGLDLDMEVDTSEQMQYCGFVDSDFEDPLLWKGRQRSAFERLLRLFGIRWVDYQDLQMHLLKRPVNFIYHKKKLKSVGLATFEKQLGEAKTLYDVLASLSPEVRFYLLYCLDPLGGGMRVYDFAPLCRFLRVQECTKLLLIAIQSFHYHFGIEERGGLITFRDLSQNIERRHEVLQNALLHFPFPRHCIENGKPILLPRGYGQLYFHASSKEKAVRANYHDAVQFDRMVKSLAQIWNHDELGRHYQGLIVELQEKLPYDTKNFEEEMEKAFREQQKKISERILKDFETRLNQAADFSQLYEIQEDMKARREEMHLSEEQQFLLKEMYEFHRSRLRDIYLGSIYLAINSLQSRESILSYWGKLKYELFSYRAYVGKEYESLIAQYLDQKLELLPA